MIVKDTATIKKHIKVNANLTYENMQSDLAAAERKLLKPILGAAQLDALSTTTEDLIIQTAINLAEEAICNYGYYLSLPVGTVNISDAGIMVPSFSDASPISDKQYKELQRHFKSMGHEAFDELLDHMEANADLFTAWTESDNYSEYKDLLVHNTKTFDKFFYIFNSRQTFIALRPTQLIVEDQFIDTPIGSTLLSALKSDQENENRIAVKELLQKSIVAFTIMKTVDNGMFVFDAQGIHMKFDALPYEKSITNVNLKINDFLSRTKKNKKIEGDNYLRKAIKLIEANPDDFEEYEIKESSVKSSVISNDSITML